MINLDKTRCIAANGMLLVMFLTGCSSVSTSHEVVTPDVKEALGAGVKHLPESAGTALSNNQGGLVLELERESLVAQPTYFAASNRYCRRVQITSYETQAAESHIACQRDNGQWSLHKTLSR